MNKKIKILTWNINRAAYTRKNFWRYLRELDFDIGLLQEVYVIPYEIRKNYHFVRGEMNAILLKKNIITNVEKENILHAKSENGIIADFCVSCETKLFGNKLVLLSVYNYMGATVSDFREFLEILCKYICDNRDKTILIGGDFNMDAKFEVNSAVNLKRWGECAREMKEKLSKLDYKEVLYENCGEKAFTFIATKNQKKYQLDYLFIPKDVRIDNVIKGDENEIFITKPRLSDHLPIIAAVEI